MKLKLILKGILLYTTVLTIFLWLSGLDDLMEKGYLLKSMIWTVSLIFICYKVIDKEEVDILTFNKKK